MIKWLRGRLQGLEASPGCIGQGSMGAEAFKKVKAPWVLWRAQMALLIGCMTKVPLKREETNRLPSGESPESKDKVLFSQV